MTRARAPSHVQRHTRAACEQARIRTLSRCWLWAVNTARSSHCLERSHAAAVDMSMCPRRGSEGTRRHVPQDAPVMVLVRLQSCRDRAQSLHRRVSARVAVSRRKRKVVRKRTNCSETCRFCFVLCSLLVQTMLAVSLARRLPGAVVAARVYVGCSRTEPCVRDRLTRACVRLCVQGCACCCFRRDEQAAVPEAALLL